MRKILKMAAVALPVVIGAAFPASAGTITNVQIPGYGLANLPTGNWGSFGFTLTDNQPGGFLDQAYGSASQSVWYGGQITLATDSGTLGVWCVDLLHDIYIGGAYSDAKQALTTNNANGAKGVQSTSLSTEQVQKIAALAALGNAVLAKFGNVNDTIDPSLRSAYNANLSLLPPGDVIAFADDLTSFSAAIQASIWDVEYRTTASGSADFNADFGLIATDIGRFGNIGGYQLTVNNGQIQGQFVSAVPEPGTLVLLGVGLISVVAARRKVASA